MSMYDTLIEERVFWTQQIKEDVATGEPVTIHNKMTEERKRLLSTFQWDMENQCYVSGATLKREQALLHNPQK